MKEAGSHKGFLGFNLLGMTWSGHQLFQFLANMTTGQDERKVVTDAIKSPSSRYAHSLLSLPPRSDWRTKRGGSEAVRMEIPYYHESPVNVVSGGRYKRFLRVKNINNYRNRNLFWGSAEVGIVHEGFNHPWWPEGARWGEPEWHEPKGKERDFICHTISIFYFPLAWAGSEWD